ncbi:right-handed parallel beta-helix repeat-containing protein [Bosea sp. NPDC055353]
MTIYYVSPTGSDSQVGTLDRPFASLQYAHDLAQPGDTIYLRGGVYSLKNGVQLTNDGESGRPITVTNYPGEKPILDGSQMTSSAYYGSSGAGGWVLDGSSISWNNISGLEVRGGPMGGIVIHDESHNNIIERLDVHDNGRLSQWEGKGVSLFGPGSNNLLQNIDSHDNHDLSGDNADGFQISTTGAGNVLRGNRAWNNSDDGFDFFNIQDGTKGAGVLIEGNWAFNNGYDASGKAEGDGNGFKLGGQRPGGGAESGGHTVINNVSWGNLSNGFDQNDASIDSVLQNNTAYNNGAYNYAYWSGHNSFVNNLSAGSGKLAVSGAGSASNNSWNYTAPTSNDFVSLNDAGARGARAADGSLPTTDFLHLSSGSTLVDKGKDVGLSYAGKAPDLGSFESGMATGSKPQPDNPGIGTQPDNPATQPDTPVTKPDTPVTQPDNPATKPDNPVETAKVFGTDKADKMVGTSGNDWIHGNAGCDVIDGGAGNDTLLGGSGRDTLIGGLGADTMSGGAGRDTFIFRSPSESLPGAGNRDVIEWFQRGTDKLDLSLIDANTAVRGDQVFHFAGKTSEVEANSVSYFHSDHHTIIQGDVDGDGHADFQIELNQAINLSRDHFIL